VLFLFGVIRCYVYFLLEGIKDFIFAKSILKLFSIFNFWHLIVVLILCFSVILIWCDTLICLFPIERHYELQLDIEVILNF
jgi:hypothetical protein